MAHACAMAKWLFSVCALAGLLSGCHTSTPMPTTVAPMAPAETRIIELPPPRIDGSMSLEAALAARRSIRTYTDEAVSLQGISQLFWSAQGVTRSWGGRTAPSAGALYPLELYAATADGVYHYLPQEHQAEVWLAKDIRQSLWAAGLQQEALEQAPTIFVMTAVYERTSAKYGDRTERYVQMEAGHAAQNLLLQAVTLGLGAVPIGAFDDDKVAIALSLPIEEAPLYLIPIGHPAE
jgi:SagB-type dehydrogenase family enzyme